MPADGGTGPTGPSRSSSDKSIAIGHWEEVLREVEGFRCHAARSSPNLSPEGRANVVEELALGDRKSRNNFSRGAHERPYFLLRRANARLPIMSGFCAFVVFHWIRTT